MTITVGLAEGLMPAVTALRRAVRRRTRERTGVPALPPAQVELLRAVQDSPGIGVAGVARRLRLADNSVSTLVRTAVADGHLRRTADPTDRRAARLELTEAAHGRLRRWRAVRAEVVDAALACLDPADHEALTAALPALTRLLDAVEEPDPHHQGGGS
ncbi:MAG TPA: MarR family winged helix-turn-helix transcriptional regulator [Actinomycetospora sp.]|uniref:MarR family winged helix-turn-helix transcriptional regulator n=1 Tax=Actinomycetospora sp. TaxID=1872135 RepID=UPI002F40C86E